MESDSSTEEEDPEEMERQRVADENAMWQDGYYVCAVAKADDADMFFNQCYNCRGIWPPMERLSQASETKPTGSEGKG